MADVRLCAVVITAPEEAWLADFVRSLVADRFCAGAHVTSPVRSIYRWQGEIYDRPEVHVTLHTRTEHVPAIIARAKDQHPYEVPCVVATEMTDAAPDYAAWIVEQTERP
ncbi:divalent-cation tolerance protein CutA [Streptomyces sp. NBC_00623]|uniref:divalent-cation tolerance protein CutA n=1 Tax=Streptomyces sp. NBC_00623 TaxID=2975790 RepID=UPI0030E03108